MKGEAKLLYIFYVECPLNGSIKFIGAGNTPKVPHDIAKSQRYFEWKKELKSKGEKMTFNIIDQVPVTEVNFWFSYYKDLFRHFGFELWDQVLQCPIDKRSNFHIFNLQEYLKRNQNQFSERYRVLNVSIILYLFNDLLSICFTNRLIDTHTLVYTMMFLFGVSIKDLRTFCFRDLIDFISDNNQITRNIDYPKPKRFVKSFIKTYANTKIENWKEESVLKGIDIDKNILNKKIDIYARYFGYCMDIRCEDYVRIFGLLYLRTHGTSRDSTDFIEKYLHVNFRYVKAYLINSSSMKFFPPSNSEVLNSILS